MPAPQGISGTGTARTDPPGGVASSRIFYRFALVAALPADGEGGFHSSGFHFSGSSFPRSCPAPPAAFLRPHVGDAASPVVRGICPPRRRPFPGDFSEKQRARNIRVSNGRDPAARLFLCHASGDIIFKHRRDALQIRTKFSTSQARQGKREVAPWFGEWLQTGHTGRVFGVERNACSGRNCFLTARIMNFWT